MSFNLFSQLMLKITCNQFIKGNMGISETLRSQMWASDYFQMILLKFKKTWYFKITQWSGYKHNLTVIPYLTILKSAEFESQLKKKKVDNWIFRHLKLRGTNVVFQLSIGIYFLLM